MLPSQTIDILKTLDKKEMKKFGDFLRSPYFNNLTALVKIYDEVKRVHPEFKGSSLKPEVMFNKLYSEDDFKESRIQNLYAEFGTQLKKFLGYEKFGEEEADINMYISEALKDKDLNKISQKFINKFLEEDNKIFLLDTQNFYRLVQFNSISVLNLGALREENTEVYTGKVNDVKQALLLFFFRLLFHISSILARDEKIFMQKGSNDMNEIFDFIHIEKLFAFLEKNNTSYASYLKVHYYLQYYVLHDINEAEYNALKKEIYKIIRTASKSESFVFIFEVIQILLEKMVPQDKKYYREIFDFSQLLSELKIFPDKAVGNFDIGPFNDIFTVAVILKEYDWAEYFVNEYSQYLNEEFRENQKNYSMGILSFKKGKFEESLEFFNKIQFIDIFEKINARFYYIMNYIELKAYESALSSLNTMKQFYKDNFKDIPEIAKPLIPDALKYFGEIIKCTEEGKKADGLLYQELNSGKRFYHAAYIREKMEKLK